MLVSCTTSSCRHSAAALQNICRQQHQVNHKGRGLQCLLLGGRGNGPLVAASSVLGAGILRGGCRCVPDLTCQGSACCSGACLHVGAGCTRLTSWSNRTSEYRCPHHWLMLATDSTKGVGLPSTRLARRVAWSAAAWLRQVMLASSAESTSVVLSMEGVVWLAEVSVALLEWADTLMEAAAPRACAKVTGWKAMLLLPAAASSCLWGGRGTCQAGGSTERGMSPPAWPIVGGCCGIAAALCSRRRDVAVESSARVVATPSCSSRLSSN